MVINYRLKMFLVAFVALTVMGITGQRVYADTAISNVTATASSYIAPYSPDKAVNTTIDMTKSMESSRWYCAGTGDKWLQLDLKEKYYVGSWHVENLGSLSWDSSCNTKVYELLGSTDGTHWTNIQTISNNTAVVTDNRVAPFLARYVKLHITQGNQKNNLWASIVDFHVSAVSPEVSSCGVPTANTYITGQNLDFTVNYSADVVVDTTGGVPYIPITIGSKTVKAEYVSGTGTTALNFRYTIQSGDSAPSGIIVGTDIISNRGILKDYVGNSSVLSLNNIGNVTGVLVDAAPPALNQGAVNRTSDTEATVKFTANKAGQYYYAVVAEGSSAPIINTSGTGTACTASETTITNPTGLTAGAKDIYIVVKDSAGNLSNTLKIAISDFTPTERQATPSFNPVSGAVAFGTELEIVSSGADHIYYTMDGTPPLTSVGGTTLEYSSIAKPLINSSTTVSAIAVKAGRINSEVATASYTQSAAANLASLVISGAPSGYNFATTTYSYNGVTVAYGTESITVTPTGTGNIKVEGITLTSGTTSAAITLKAGVEKTITITVEEAGKLTKTYQVKLTRENDVPDTTKPIITLKGMAAGMVMVGGNYVDPGATAFDNKDGNITANIVKTITNMSGITVASIDTSVTGTYTIHYNVSDAAGNRAIEATRGVMVVSAPTPPPVSAAISNLTAVAGDGQVTLTFAAPEGAISVAVEKAIIGAGFSATTTTSAITAASTSAVVTGLTNEVTYSFRLVVTGGSHAGVSNVTTATPIAVAPPPAPPIPTPSAPLVTLAPSEPNITVVNNVEGTPDVVTVIGLTEGDVVKVYDTLATGRLIGTATVSAGQTSAIINIAQLGMNAGNVYVSVTNIGKAESARTGKAYTGEIRNSSISMSAAGFDKNASTQADLNVVVTLNGNTLTSIKNGSNTLVAGTDYIGSGNVVTIKKSYLITQSLGNTVLTFNFSSGNSQTMTVNIVDTTTPVPSKDANTTGGGSTAGGSNSSSGSGESTSGGSTSGGGSAGGNSSSSGGTSAGSNTTTETRTVDVVAGSGSDTTAAPVKVEITRTVESGTKVDAVKLDETKVTETIAKAVEANKDVATVLITDLKANPADLVEVQVPKISSSKLADSGIALKIEAPKAIVQIPSETLKSLGSDVKITMKEVTDVSKINDTKALVLRTVGDSNIVGNPVEVETNFSGRTEITIPLKTENLPKDPVELKKVLDSLAVQIHHSDGENATEKGTIVYDEKGNPVGISIWVDKFSTFTVIALSKDGMDKLTANNGLISDRAAQNGGSNNSGANNTNVSNVQVPEIKFVGLEHSPLITGDKEGFIISSGYDGNVQYRIYLNVEGAWQEVTNGYSAAVSGKETFSITPDYAFQKGQYQGRVYVKKAGAVGSKQEDGIDFDNYYTYNINCVDRDDANRVYTVGNLAIKGLSITSNITGTKGSDNANSTSTSATANMNAATENNNSFKVGQKITITGVDNISGIPGPYYYRLHIYDVANDTWTNNVVPYSEKLEWTPSAAGTYVLDIHVITPNSVLWDKVQNDPTLIYGGYEGWKLKNVRVSN